MKWVIIGFVLHSDPSTLSFFERWFGDTDKVIRYVSAIEQTFGTKEECENYIQNNQVWLTSPIPGRTRIAACIQGYERP